MRILITRRVRTVHILVCLAAALIVLGMVSADLQAGEYQITYTAEDLLSRANFPVPDRQPTLINTANGTSLYFDRAYDGPPRWQKLMELPIFPAGTLPSDENCIIRIVINHTWIPNDATDPGDDLYDWDPHFMLGDGVNLVGVTTLQQGDQGFGGVDLAWCEDFLVEVEDLPYPPCEPCPEDPSEICCSQWVSYQGISDGDPELNVPYDLKVTYGLNWPEPPQTRVNVLEGNLGWPIGWGGLDSPVTLNPARSLTFVFVSDNQLHEEYQINSVTVTVTSEHLPDLTCNCGNPGFFDPPMDTDVTVKKGNRVIPLKFTLCDDEGYEVTDIELGDYPPMAQVIYKGPPEGLIIDEELTTVGHGDDGNLFEWVSGHWQLNLQTKMFEASGIYEISVISTDPSYTIFPTCSVRFIIE